MRDANNCGIYTITAPSGNCYVGSSINIAKRWKRHIKEMADGTHVNATLKNAYRKYGAALCFNTIIICEKQNLIMYEQAAIDALKPKYNISPTAGSVLGIRYPAEVYASRAAAAKLRRASPETKRLIGLKSTGRLFSEESRIKKSVSLRATAMIPDVKARRREIAKLSNSNEETRKKISASLKGRKKPPRTAEHSANLAASKRASHARKIQARIAALSLKPPSR